MKSLMFFILVGLATLVSGDLVLDEVRPYYYFSFLRDNTRKKQLCFVQDGDSFSVSLDGVLLLQHTTEQPLMAVGKGTFEAIYNQAIASFKKPKLLKIFEFSL